MKNNFTKILALALVLAMLAPALHEVATPIVALTVDGYIGNMDANLTKDLISPAPATLNMENNGGIRFACARCQCPRPDPSGDPDQSRKERKRSRDRHAARRT